MQTIGVMRVSWGSAAYVSKGADWVGAKGVTRDAEDGVTAKAAGRAHSLTSVCVVLCWKKSHGRAGQGRQAGKCVNSSRNKLGSRVCGKRASLQRALRFASLGAHRDRPMHISMCGQSIDICNCYIHLVQLRLDVWQTLACASIINLNTHNPRASKPLVARDVNPV